MCIQPLPVHFYFLETNGNTFHCVIIFNRRFSITELHEVRTQPTYKIIVIFVQIMFPTLLIRTQLHQNIPKYSMEEGTMSHFRMQLTDRFNRMSRVTLGENVVIKLENKCVFIRYKNVLTLYIPVVNMYTTYFNNQ